MVAIHGLDDGGAGASADPDAGKKEPRRDANTKDFTVDAEMSATPALTDNSQVPITQH